MHDLILRNAFIIDGSGAPAWRGDVAVDGDRIASIGELQSHTAHRVIDLEGAALAPGFIDIHTHYDGQATWDPYLSPSSSHGVTSVVIGNCGMGFAPVKQIGRAHV